MPTPDFPGQAALLDAGEAGAIPGVRTCSKKCRQALYRLRKRSELEAVQALPMRVAIADPPYPGLSSKYYRSEESFAGEVDHAELVQRLERDWPAGWLLCTSADALGDVLALVPKPRRVCAWVKPIGAAPLTLGIHNTWEPCIVRGGRQRQPGVRDWLSAQPARFEGDLMGRKPIAWCAWAFNLLGLQPGDELDDLFPGTGIVGRAWRELSTYAEPTGYASSRYRIDDRQLGFDLMGNDE